MILTGKDLAEIGELLHGDRWRKWLAEKLDRSERTIRLYETGEVRVPRKIRLRLQTVIQEQRFLLDAWTSKISG